MVISSKFRMAQYRDDDHQEDAPHFISTFQRNYTERVTRNWTESHSQNRELDKFSQSESWIVTNFLI